MNKEFFIQSQVDQQPLTLVIINENLPKHLKQAIEAPEEEEDLLTFQGIAARVKRPVVQGFSCCRLYLFIMNIVFLLMHIG